MGLQSASRVFLLLFSLGEVLTTVARTSLNASTARPCAVPGCQQFSDTGIDYADANLSVVPGADQEVCCQACSAHNANASAIGNCTIVVWLKDPQLCCLKATSLLPIKGLHVVANQPVPSPPTPPPPGAFRFASIYGDGMVLQAAPLRANVWGFCQETDVVSVSLDGKEFPARVAARTGPGNTTLFVWSVVLPKVEASATAHSLTATTTAKTARSTASVTLTGVVFGDVWVCSGQSNMAYGLNGSNGLAIVHPPVNNSEVEIADMLSYPDIRLFRAGHAKASEDQLELQPADAGGSLPAVTGWSEPCPGGDVASCRVDFSSVCWFFGRNIYEGLARKRPIGLIGTYFGGTADELWSSADALRECLNPDEPIPPADETLWHGMVAPLLNTTIKGVVWYQGEADAGRPGGQYDGYNCTFPAMIADWRAKWTQGTGGLTEPVFPFGLVQLNSNGNGTVYNNPADPDDPLSPKFGFAGLRWSQTASHGSVPNAAMPNVFMATSLDTPDRPIAITVRGKVFPPYSVHSPFKQPVAARLARAGLAQAYGVDVDTVGPVVKSVSLTTFGNEQPAVMLQLAGVGSGAGVQLHGERGFEVLVNATWRGVSVLSHTRDTVTLSLPSNSSSNSLLLSKLRYSWYSNPCGPDSFGCVVYVAVAPLGRLSGQMSFLPLSPFIGDIVA